MRPLTPRQLAFAAAYAKHGVAERAAIEAGYSRKTARAQVTRLLTNVGIAAEVKRLTGQAAERAQVDVDRVVDELSLIGFADLSDFVEWGFDPGQPEAPQVRLKPSKKLDAAKRRAIVEVSETQFGVRIKLADKLGALDRLARTLGMFVDKVEHSGEIKNAAPVVNLTLTANGTKGKGGADG